MEKLIELRSMAASAGGHRILDGIDLTVGSGASLTVVGPNGSGKTTLLRVLATLLRPSSGSGRVLGADVGGPVDRAVRSKIGFISHAPGLLDELTLRENLRHFARLAGADPDQCERSLEAVGLGKAGDRRVSAASFGMKRRTEIAWLLVKKPSLLLLDEARYGLDSDARALVDTLWQRTVDRGGAVVSVSHQETAPPEGAGTGTLLRLTDGKLVGSS